MEKTFRMTVKDEDPRKKENDIVMSQIDVYLEERRYVVKVLTEMCRAAMSGAEDNVWAETGRQVMEECVMKQGGMLAKLVEGIKKRWTTGKNESAAWINVMSAFEEPEKLAFGGEKQMMLEVIHLLQLLFLQLYRPWEEITGQFVVSWFELMRETQYLAVRSNVRNAFFCWKANTDYSVANNSRKLESFQPEGLLYLSRRRCFSCRTTMHPLRSTTVSRVGGTCFA